MSQTLNVQPIYVRKEDGSFLRVDAVGAGGEPKRFRLLNTITLPEDASEIACTEDSDGNPFLCEEMYISAVIKPAATEQVTNWYPQFNGKVTGNSRGGLSTTAESYIAVYAIELLGLHTLSFDATSTRLYNLGSLTPQFHHLKYNENYNNRELFSRAAIISHGAKYFGAGSVVQFYGR